MDAKAKQRIQEEIVRAYAGTDPDVDIDWEMIEISFRAGIREALEYVAQITNNPICEYKDNYLCLHRKMWQAKLKEWGIA